MKVEIPLAKPWLTEYETNRVAESVSSGWLTQAGHEVGLMEESIFSFLNPAQPENFSVTTASNGTTALHLILLAIGVGPGDEVIIPNFAYIAVVNTVLYCGATPVLIDCISKNWNMDKGSAISAITSKTKAIIFVDNYGNLEDLEEFRKKIPKEIKLIRDAAESFPGKSFDGSAFNGADFTSFSFYANKVFTAGEGGAIYGATEDIEKISILKNQALENKGTFKHESIGYNYRLSNMHAAIFNAQWSRSENILKERARVFAKYEKLLQTSRLSYKSNFEANPWLFTIRLFENYPIVHLRDRLNEHGIETRPGFSPFSDHAYIAKNSRLIDDNGEAIKISKEIISLPTWPELSEEKIEYIVHNLVETVSK